MRLLLTFFISPLFLFAQPSTEVYVFDISQNTEGYTLTNPINVSNNNPGYDNQPHFTLEGNLLFTSTVNNQTDGMLYDFKSSALKNLTNSSANEYSPTPTPDNTGFSCVYDSMQYLVKYNYETGTQEILIDDLVVGYHCWLDATNVVLFVLGDVITLQHYDLKSGKKTILDNKIDRSLLKIPNTNSFSYIDRKTTPKSIIKMNLQLMTKQVIATLPNESQDIAWLPNGTILTGDGSKLLMTTPRGEWKELADLAEYQLTGITRIAVSPDGKKIAFVVNK